MNASSSARPATIASGTASRVAWANRMRLVSAAASEAAAGRGVVAAPKDRRGVVIVPVTEGEL
ncbi:hypothetical protein ACQEVF_38985 [Nonomuraea polychroma]|uniref:hypothetical protein n=1 Tax=Nonomuraea polychroma TaxID=46176 RepID=UPI003D9387F2